MYELKKKLERYLRVNLLGPGPLLIKKQNLPGRGLTKIEKHWSRRFEEEKNLLLCLQSAPSLSRRAVPGVDTVLPRTIVSSYLRKAREKITPCGE